MDGWDAYLGKYVPRYSLQVFRISGASRSIGPRQLPANRINWRRVGTAR